jgi:voltage-gated potassium channel
MALDILAPGPDASAARRRTYQIVFGHQTKEGRAFDIVLIGAIVASVGVVVLESVAPLRSVYGSLFRNVEYGFTALFTVEYLVRLWCVSRPGRYARSFFGVIDLLAVAPTYLAVLIPGGQVLTVVRILRVLRVFRILKLGQYMGEARLLSEALRASRVKITVFLFTVVTLVVVVGSLIYLVEGRYPQSGFTSIPTAMYWAVVTLTTVGYGDIAPVTTLGKMMASVIMIMGYGIIAVPTGIVSVEIAQATRSAQEKLRCPDCNLRDHARDARFCRRCGEALTFTAPEPVPPGDDPAPGGPSSG